jgi:short-subunit dehydrogenase
MPCPLPSEDGTCLITGASAGIGAELARELSGRGYHVTLAARRVERLEALAAELPGEVAVRECDVRSIEQREALLAGAGRRIDILVNNAGLGGAGRFWEVPRERASDMVETNVLALVDLTRRAVAPMVARGEGAILNIASTAGYQPIPTEAVYSASKAFVLNFGEALSVELEGTGVTCTTLCPGPTRTEFAAVAGNAKLFNRLPGPLLADARPVAAAGVEAMLAGRRTCVPGISNRISAVAGGMTPRPLVLWTLKHAWPGVRS